MRDAGGAVEGWRSLRVGRPWVRQDPCHIGRLGLTTFDLAQWSAPAAVLVCEAGASIIGGNYEAGTFEKICDRNLRRRVCGTVLH
jgi:hypothetical protein